MTHSDKVRELIQKGIIVCPRTKERLVVSGESSNLVSLSSRTTYRMHQSSVPVLLIDDQINYDNYASSSMKMSEEYSIDAVTRSNSLLGRLYLSLSSDYRSLPSRKAFEFIFEKGITGNYVAVGGGPVRAHPALINLNIGPFPNVDVVADAHILPFAQDSIDAIYCEAVLEHLYKPDRAVAQMYQALKSGGRVYACTPFLQSYHGYPFHYQNFTLTGHQRLFEEQGFVIQDAGVAVGPAYSLMALNGTFLYEFLPKPFNWVFGKTLGFFARFVRPFDVVLNRRPNAHLLASTTYLLAVKK